MLGCRACCGWRPFVLAEVLEGSAGWRLASRNGCGDSFANVALESVNEFDDAILLELAPCEHLVAKMRRDSSSWVGVLTSGAAISKLACVPF